MWSFSKMLFMSFNFLIYDMNIKCFTVIGRQLGKFLEAVPVISPLPRAGKKVIPRLSSTQALPKHWPDEELGKVWF